MPKAYSITSEAIAAERRRVGDDLSQFDAARVIQLDEVVLREMGPRDVRVRILAVAVEHNVDHAVLADTVNITELRGGKIYPGNSAVAEVLEVGAEVTRFRRGDIVVTHANGEPDPYGYPLRIWAYDQPDSVGWYAQEAVVGASQLIPAPLDCGLSLWEMAALPLRAPTAYHLWRRAISIFRIKVPRERLARLNVLAFGGGVSELFLMLARHEGHRTFFCSGNAARREKLAALGITPIDQSAFERFAEATGVRAFTKEMKSRTGGVGVHIVCDMLRGPIFPVGVAVLARQGVNVSAGWQLDKRIQYDSAALSVKQVSLEHVHLETVEGSNAATELYGTVFRPAIHDEIYSFQDLPRALRELHRSLQTGIPIVRVAEEMPAVVTPLLR
jgi:NADPH:quinone reductase-like Zn-dependent oxidoreductase